MDKDNIKVEGHRGTWYVLDEVTKFGKTFYLLEHNTYGEDANHIAIDNDGKLVLEDITDGTDELLTFLEEEYKQ